MGFCDSLISTGITRDCYARVPMGLKPNAWLFNKADLSELDLEGNILSGYTLKAQAKGVRVYQEGAQPFSGSQTTLTAASATMRGSVTHTVNIRILDPNPLISEEFIDSILGGAEMVLFVETKANGDYMNEQGEVGGSYYPIEVIGAENPLRLGDGATRDFYSEETNGGWLIPLTSTGNTRSTIYFDAGTPEETRLKLDTDTQ